MKLVLLAVMENTLGVVVLGPPIDRRRPVYEARDLRLDEAAAALADVADAYARTGEIEWCCCSDAERDVLRALGVLGDRDELRGRVHVVPAHPKRLRPGEVPAGQAVPLTSPACQAAWALAHHFRLGRRWSDA